MQDARATSLGDSAFMLAPSCCEPTELPEDERSRPPQRCKPLMVLSAARRRRWPSLSKAVPARACPVAVGSTSVTLKPPCRALQAPGLSGVGVIPILCGMQARRVTGLRIVGGHPALDLANTISSRRGGTGIDCLDTYDDLLVWAARQGVMDEAEASKLRAAAQLDPAAAAVALQDAKQLRECIWRVWTAMQAGMAPAAADLALLASGVLAAQRARVLRWSGAQAWWQWTEAAGLDAVTARVALAAAELFAGEHLHRVRECEGLQCGWLFLDSTRNGTRRWCVAEQCGSLDRVTRFRAKRKIAG